MQSCCRLIVDPQPGSDGVTAPGVVSEGWLASVDVELVVASTLASPISPVVVDAALPPPGLTEEAVTGGEEVLEKRTDVALVEVDSAGLAVSFPTAEEWLEEIGGSKSSCLGSSSGPPSPSTPPVSGSV